MRRCAFRQRLGGKGVVGPMTNTRHLNPAQKRAEVRINTCLRTSAPEGNFFTEPYARIAPACRFWLSCPSVIVTSASPEFPSFPVPS